MLLLLRRRPFIVKTTTISSSSLSWTTTTTTTTSRRTSPSSPSAIVSSPTRHCSLTVNHHHHHHQHERRCFSSFSSSSSSSSRIVDLRSDTVTKPSTGMLEAAVTAPVGDDVMGEDPTVLELEERMANMFGKQRALFVPTGTMANLVALLSHCHYTKAAEIIIGQKSHINLWEGGNAANIGGIHTIQIPEHPETARLSVDDIRNSIRIGYDDHWPETTLLCLENTHNMCGGVALDKPYFDEIGKFIHGDGGGDVNLQQQQQHPPPPPQMKVHVDGARIMNAIVALDEQPSRLMEHVDSISVCFSKGLGAPVGSVLVGDSDLITLAKRARKRCGGGMRQAGVVAAMGLYAIEHNVERLADDHDRAKRLGKALVENGFELLREGQIDSNIVYFGLPESCTLSKDEFLSILSKEYGVKVTGGYSDGGRLFRAVTHMDVDDDGMDRAINAIISTAKRTS